MRDAVTTPPRGFGSVRVEVTLGETTWRTSVFPEAASGCFVLPVKKAVRRAEGVDPGDVGRVRGPGGRRMSGPITGPDGLARCPWGGGDDPVYVAYHDTEWGMPVRGESAHLERLTLEAFQSGLSWRTILMKREAFRSAFAGFDADVVASYDDSDVERLMADAGIVRNGAKIRAAITNAGATVALRADGGLEAFIEGFRPEPRPGPRRPGRRPRDHGRVGGARQGAQEARVRLRRPDDRLRPDAGDRPGRRPPGGLPPPRLRRGRSVTMTP